MKKLIAIKYNLELPTSNIVKHYQTSSNGWNIRILSKSRHHILLARFESIVRSVYCRFTRSFARGKTSGSIEASSTTSPIANRQSIGSIVFLYTATRVSRDSRFSPKYSRRIEMLHGLWSSKGKGTRVHRDRCVLYTIGRSRADPTNRYFDDRSSPPIYLQRFHLTPKSNIYSYVASSSPPEIAIQFRSL